MAAFLIPPSCDFTSPSGGRSQIDLQGGNNVVYANGVDTIYAGTGFDQVYGADFDTEIYGDSGFRYVKEGDGDNYVDLGYGRGELFGGLGHDTLIGGGAGNSYLVAAEGCERAVGRGALQGRITHQGKTGEQGQGWLAYPADSGQNNLGVARHAHFLVLDHLMSHGRMPI